MYNSNNSIPEELDKALLALLRLADIPCPNNLYSSADIKRAVSKVEHVLQTNGLMPKPGSAAAVINHEHQDNGPRSKTILMAGETGIISYQVKQAVAKLGASVTVCKDVNESIQEFQRQDYGIVLIDLNMPTEREGMMVLSEIHRISSICGLKAKIMVLAGPSKDKKLRETCLAQGAHYFLEKAEGWHKRVVDFCMGQFLEIL